jgi:hypothetical protein
VARGGNRRRARRRAAAGLVAGRIYKLVARDDLAGDPVGIARTITDEDQILLEDLAVLERYHAMEPHLDPPVEVHTKADRLSLGWRRLLGEWTDLTAG